MSASVATGITHLNVHFLVFCVFLLRMRIAYQSTARKSLSFIDFLEALGRVSDMQTRTGDLRFQPWDTETEGISEVPLHVSMRDGLFAQLLAK